MQGQSVKLESRTQSKDSILKESISMRKADRTTLALFTCFFLAACAVYFTHLGAHPIFNPDEALYAEPAREMLETGEYVTTYLNYQVRYTKPPLSIWAIAACMKTLGVTEFAARFFSACCGAILLGVTYLFTEKYAGRNSAILAALALLIAPLFLAISRLALTDMPLSLFIAGSLMSLFHGFQVKEGRFKWIAYVLLGLGVMTKGPVALAVPAGVMFVYHLLMGEIKKAWAYYNPLSGLLVIALIAVPWFALEIYVTKGEYFEAFIMRENLERFTAVVDHKYPWWYHIAAMFGGFFPFSLFLPFAWYQAISRFRSRASGSFDQCYVFLAVWSLCVLGFFSLSVSKLIPYTLPAFPAIAALSGIFASGLISRASRLPIASFLALIAVLSSISFFTLEFVESKVRDCPPDLITLLPGTILTLLAISLVSFLLALKKRLFASLVSFCCLMVLMVGFFGPKFLDVFANEWEEPVQAFCRYAALSDRPILVHSIRKPSATYYAERRVEMCPTEDLLVAHMTNSKEAYIIARSKNAEFFKSIDGCKVMLSQGRFLLVSWINPNFRQEASDE